MKLLTIAVPSYNVEKTLAATLDSLCIADAVEKLDVLVVNDGSTDGTAGIARGYLERFPQCVRLINKENGGHGSAVNAGIAAAQGRYFRVVDGDDRLAQRGLLKLLGCLEETDCDLVAANYEKVPADGGAAQPVRFAGVEYGRVYGFDELPADGSIYFGIHSSVFKTSIFTEHALRLQEHTYYVDTEFCLLPVPFIKTVLFLEETVYLYSVGGAGQSINFDNFVSHYDDHYRVVRRMAAYCAAAECAVPQREYMFAAASKLCFTQYMLAAFYDSDRARGRRRAAEFDAWLAGASPPLYGRLGRSLSIRAMRLLHFRALPGARLKSAVKHIYTRLRPLSRGKHRFTYYNR
ncbi:MAG: glycosyltransferase family 2 protein [Clostridia bacterium]|nr:glycosyltransferase family 2 protein [Clostridia bacterium]MDR3643959.1 glycosyltransferase family 2 protein [Clostridia bacterium]